MADEGDERAEHLRAIIITTIAALAGVAAGIGSSVLTADVMAAEGANAAAGDTMAQLLVIVAIVVQVPVYQFVYDDWGGAKDTLFVAFMTFVLWFVTWAIILTTGATIV